LLTKSTPCRARPVYPDSMKVSDPRATRQVGLDAAAKGLDGGR
jgi:hypothetical protein